MTKHRKIQSKSQSSWMDALPPVLLDRIRLCASERQVPPEIPLMVALAAIATCAGSGIEVVSGTRRTTRANLFVLLGVSSGVGKSEVFRDMLAPVLGFEAALHEWWSQTPSVKARAGEELLKARISGMRTEIRKLHGGGVMTIFKLLEKAERARMACGGFREPPCLLADDSTSEALAQMMHRSTESIATVSADARYLLKRLGTPDTKEESFFLKGYSGDLALTNRVSRNSVRLRRPCLTTLLLTQGDAYRTFVQKAVLNRSGLLPRFLHAPIKQSESDQVPVDGRRVSRIRIAYDEKLKEVLEAYRFETTPTMVDVSKAATNFITEIECDCRMAAKTDESLHSEVLRRRAEQTWRVALCLHLVRHGNTSALHSLKLNDAESAAKIVKCFTAIDST